MNVANEAIAGHAHPGSGTSGAHGSRKSYVIGFALAIILTAIPFGLVMSHAVSATPLLIAGFAIAQIVVHVVYFLHVNRSEEQRWNLIALVFTAIVVFIILGGSIWIMHQLYANMMPMWG